MVGPSVAASTLGPASYCCWVLTFRGDGLYAVPFFDTSRVRVGVAPCPDTGMFTWGLGLMETSYGGADDSDAALSLKSCLAAVFYGDWTSLDGLP